MKKIVSYIRDYPRVFMLLLLILVSVLSFNSVVKMTNSIGTAIVNFKYKEITITNLSDNKQTIIQGECSVEKGGLFSTPSGLTVHCWSNGKKLSYSFQKDNVSYTEKRIKETDFSIVIE